MNKLIEELMLNSGTTGKPQVWFTRPEMEKFAELIVNDVLNIVAISGEQCNCSTLFRKISEHFGVEE